MRRRFFVMNGSVLTYTSSTQSKLSINLSAFNIPVKSHTYDEIGLIKFNGVLSEIGGLFISRSSLLTCVLPTKVISIGDDAFSGCTSLESIIIPDGVKFIGKYAFRYCYSLTSVTIPDSVTTIGNYAFSDCLSLTSVTIPDSVTTIGDRAFQSCDRLTSVTIPDSVKTIGTNAFYSCDRLTSVYCKPTTPPTLGNAFVFGYNASNRKIYVPYQSLDAYKTATNWSEYADDIVGYDFENDVVVG